MSSGPFASSMPGCHSRKTSGVLGATTTGSAVNAPRARSVLARWRASYSPLIGQQKARRQVASPGKDSSRLRSIRSRQASRTSGVTRSRSEMSRSRCVLRHALSSAVSIAGGMLSYSMILKYFRDLSSILAGLALTGVTAAATVATPDHALVGAYDAYRAGNALRLARHAKDLDGHALKPWVDYWRLALRLEDTS